MIKKLHIKNFKSIKDLELDCARVNVFIGEPNTGKSNILESIGILSFGYTHNLKDFVRFEKTSNLFHNNEINKAVKINFTIGRELIINTPFADDIDNLTHKIDITYSKDSNLIIIKSDGGSNLVFPDFDVTYDAFSGRFLVSGGPATTTMIQFYPVRFFRLNDLKFEKPDDIYILKPPDGRNLMNVLSTNRDILDFAIDLVKPYDFKIRLLKTGQIELTREFNDVSFEIPFELLSDTFIKMIMLYAAIETSSKHVLVFEEPESHVFPFYNKFLAERIALYNTNQFFIATHNPTFLTNFIEQTTDEELKIFITYYEDYQTKVFELSGDKLRETYKLFGGGIFGNLEKIVKNLDKILEKERQDSK